MTAITTADRKAELGARRVAPERYELLEVLGQGAMGVVYKARDRELDRIVAIKTIHPEHTSRADFEAIAARLSREAMAAARLSHRGIVTVYDVGRVESAPYVVMEYVTGRTLSEVLEAGPLPPAKAAQVLLEVCRALEYAHAQGVVHRDIKSSNIMVDARWNTKLTDFGVARIVDKPANEAGMMIGTPAYMAPEQVRGDAGDARSDLFSVGVVLYEALTAARPFPGDDLARVLEDVVHLDPVPPRERNFAVSPALNAVVRRAMSKDPDDRYPDAAALALALTQAVAMTETPAVTSVVNLARRHNGVLVGSILATLSVGAAMYVATGGEDRAPRVEAIQEAPRPQRPPAPSRPPEAIAPADAAPAKATRPAPAAAATPKADPVAGRPAAAESAVAAPAGKPGCVSVNAVPFATVFVDGRRVGDTPEACVLVSPGRHRVQFQWAEQRSPEHTIVVESRHTRDSPLTASYDFRAGRFVSNSD
jgi:serine/threonine-protein kinase